MTLASFKHDMINSFFQIFESTNWTVFKHAATTWLLRIINFMYLTCQPHFLFLKTIIFQTWFHCQFFFINDNFMFYIAIGARFLIQNRSCRDIFLLQTDGSIPFHTTFFFWIFFFGGICPNCEKSIHCNWLNFLQLLCVWVFIAIYFVCIFWKSIIESSIFLKELKHLPCVESL